MWQIFHPLDALLLEKATGIKSSPPWYGGIFTCRSPHRDQQEGESVIIRLGSLECSRQILRKLLESICIIEMEM